MRDIRGEERNPTWLPLVREIWSSSRYGRKRIAFLFKKRANSKPFILLQILNLFSSLIIEKLESF